jgi:phycobilisome core-membrane linker protein|uniref:Phycobiliprotein ApcE n=1 Tax=Thorea hispida TaxID=202687 RepID=A0A1C9CAA5_9FLOR|nr:phycobilisome core-membrane linker protein [Thorea hispida]AOM65320.1 phycobilisome core-membrane linker protein [Thorea hispida]ARX95880.1 phycobillisome linker protein [Thorea hispida]
MSVKASGGSPVTKPQLYRTVSISTIVQAEKQDRFLQPGELNQMTAFLESGYKRLEVAEILTKNADILVAKAADRIFIGGSAISYLERPQASTQLLKENKQVERSGGLNSLFNTGEATPPGFKPINIARYGSLRMKKSLRDLDWFLRYLTYAIVAGDPNILAVNIRGLRELIDNACSSAAAIVALREIRKISLAIFNTDNEAKSIVLQYCNVIISEFESSGTTDILRKRFFGDAQGLRLPQAYIQAGSLMQKFVMKPTLSTEEKNTVIKSCYKQIFERDICKSYGLSFSDLESQVKNGQLSIKEFVRCLGKSSIYRKQFFEPFVNSRALELAFKHFLGRGLSSLTEFQKFFAILSSRGLGGLVDTLINSQEYADYFNEETVPYERLLGEEPQECRNWGPQIKLFNYSAPFTKTPQFITLFSDYIQALPDQHPYGRSNDPLLIQFGAIFPSNTINSNNKPAPFSKDTRRLLIHRGPGIYNQVNNPRLKSKIPGSLGPVVLQKSSSEFSIDAIVQAIYLRVFGRKVYAKELLDFKSKEDAFYSGKISIREFIRYLAQTPVFRKLYWQPFYICKAIEYIHHRLLGRPTYGRQEMNKYFDIIYKQNYYQFIDSILNSSEYMETFGEDTVPYERYITASSLTTRKLYFNSDNYLGTLKQNNKLNKFIILGTVTEFRSLNNISKKLMQGVSCRRSQAVIFKVSSKDTSINLEKALRATYRQIFERDITPFSVGYEFSSLEKAFMLQEISVKQLIEKLGYSSTYQKEFYQPYPNTKVIELGTKHFLGRAPNNQAEIRYYNQILASQGLCAFISSLVNSLEYKSLFGDFIVPYRRFPTLPAANFPNTEKLYNKLTKQNTLIVVPSFKLA